MSLEIHAICETCTGHGSHAINESMLPDLVILCVYGDNDVSTPVRPEV